MAIGEKEFIFAFQVRPEIKAAAKVIAPPYGILVGGGMGLVPARQIYAIGIDVILELCFQLSVIGVDAQ